MSTPEEEAAAAGRALWEMVQDPKMRRPRCRRSVLVRRETGELEFEQEEFDALCEELVAEMCGLPKPERRVIRLDSLPMAARQASIASLTNDQRDIDDQAIVITLTSAHRGVRSGQQYAGKPGHGI